MKKERDISLDIIRIFAFLSVISVHFFLHSGFYKDTIFGTKDFILVTIREFFMICVPLFIILTGYLNNKKELSKKYYKSLVPKLLTYLLAAICQILVIIFYEHKTLTIISILKTILNFDIHYGWYMNMYIGLFLIIPFLNLIYNNLKTKKDKQILILTFLILTCLPSILKIQLLFSNWWMDLYPITYYFIGCYLKEYKLNINKLKNTMLILILLIIYGIINYYLCRNSTFIKTNFNYSWGGVMPLTLSVLVFNLLLNFKLNKNNKIITKISALTFGGYLVEWIFDRIAYDYLNSKVLYENRIYYFILCVLFVFICSIILSYIINFIVDLIMKLIENISFKYKRSR